MLRTPHKRFRRTCQWCASPTQHEESASAPPAHPRTCWTVARATARLDVHRSGLLRCHSICRAVKIRIVCTHSCSAHLRNVSDQEKKNNSWKCLTVKSPRLCKRRTGGHKACSGTCQVQEQHSCLVQATGDVDQVCFLPGQRNSPNDQ